ncbi:LUD domain-containing protein [Actinomadura hibisca]|uniref:LUD domain-containing protein n=1 Tax=Actinomadura hibisca TaxID=68565 RepID=UPI00082DB25E|nr:LUD domain-containing protein [Actinomadura hibisca]
MTPSATPSSPRPRFADAAREALADPASRGELRGSVAAVRARRAAAVAELPDWGELRAAGSAVRERTLLNLDALLEDLERAVIEAGGIVHWAADAAEARRIVRGLVGAGEVVRADAPVLREIGLTATPLPDRLPAARAGVCGIDFMVAETGTMVLLEETGAGRACLALPGPLVAVAGIEQVVPTWRDLEVFLHLLPRSAGGPGGAGRFSPAVSTWTGSAPGDGPGEFHLVLLDNGRTGTLADEVGRAALRCIGCAACVHVCPVYERVGGAPYGPVRAGPIGAILTPQLRGVGSAANASLPFASTLCGACAEVCPVGIDIPEILVHLRGRVVESRRHRPVPTPELAMMRTVAWTLSDRRRYETALRRGTRWARLLARGGRVRRLPGVLGLLGRWTDARDLPVPPPRPFRAWWADRPGGGAR